MNTNNSQFTFYTLIEIRFADPVSAIGINDKFIATGTMMGRISLLSIADKKSILLAELSSENITGISFESNEFFNISIGDYEVLRYHFENDESNIPSCTRIKNYSMESDHNNNCESCFTLLSSQNIFRIFLHQPDDGNMNIQTSPSIFEIKNLELFTANGGDIEMSNYSVPFDFDGERFVWVEFLNNNERNICVYYFKNNFPLWKYRLQKQFGHISHCKLFPNNRLFIVRKFNLCETRETNTNFSIVHSFSSIGDEVIAVDIYLNQTKNILNEIDLENAQNNKKNDIFIKIPGDNPISKEQELVNVNNSEDPRKVSDENISIALLDIDGNVNVWENLTIAKKFNLYALSDISNEYKEKQFFSMGYPYYIKMNSTFFAVTTDHGTFVIRKN